MSIWRGPGHSPWTPDAYVSGNVIEGECSEKPCEVIQHSDMTKCHSCGLSWDTNDQFPPSCPWGERRLEHK